MKRGSRATRAIAWGIAASLATGIGAAAYDAARQRGGNAELAIVVGELRSRAAESALVARNADRATDTYVRVQAMQLAKRVTTARDDIGDVKGGDARVKTQAQAQADTVLTSLRRMQMLPGKEALAEIAGELTGVAQTLLGLERSIR